MRIKTYQTANTCNKSVTSQKVKLIYVQNKTLEMMQSKNSQIKLHLPPSPLSFVIHVPKKYVWFSMKSSTYTRSESEIEKVPAKHGSDSISTIKKDKKVLKLPS